MKKILLIEDNKDMRENTSEILELANYQVITAANGRDGVKAAMSENPDLIICDIMMPVLDGYGVLHALSKNEQAAGIPFIFLTAKAEKSEMRKGMEMGADDYLTKPFDDIELLNAVETRLKKAEAMRMEFSKDLSGLNEFVASAGDGDALRKMTEEQEVRTYTPKSVIYREGSFPRGIFFLNKGKVKTYKQHELGKEFITGLHGEGDFFGYISVMEEKPFAESAETLEVSEIYFIPKDAFFAMLFGNPQVSKKFIRMLANDLADREEQLLSLAYSSVRKRVAEALVSLHSRYKGNQKETFSMDILREDLANLVGTAKETLIRALGDFKDEGLIETEGRSIRVRDLQKLVSMRN